MAVDDTGRDAGAVEEDLQRDDLRLRLILQRDDGFVRRGLGRVGGRNLLVGIDRGIIVAGLRIADAVVLGIGLFAERLAFDRRIARDAAGDRTALGVTCVAIVGVIGIVAVLVGIDVARAGPRRIVAAGCLLYTSDAADE